MDIDHFTRLADEMMEVVPAPLLEGLSGGVVVRPEARRGPEDPPGVYRLGEYVNDEWLGAFIVLYHGSFRKVLAGQPPEVWEQELWETLRHELRHHIETRAGVSDLDREDQAHLEALWDEWARRRRGRRRGEPPRPTAGRRRR